MLRSLRPATARRTDLEAPVGRARSPLGPAQSHFLLLGQVVRVMGPAARTTDAQGMELGGDALQMSQ